MQSTYREIARLKRGRSTYTLSKGHEIGGLPAFRLTQAYATSNKSVAEMNLWIPADDLEAVAEMLRKGLRHTPNTVGSFEEANEPNKEADNA